MNLEQIIKSHNTKKITLSISAAASLVTSLSAAPVNSLIDVENIAPVKKQEKIQKYGVNFIATTDDVLGAGASYTISDNFKLGLGYLQVDDIESNFGVKDKFQGGYATLEAKANISNLELFLDATTINGETKTEKIEVKENIFGGGVKYKFKDLGLKTFLGATSEESVYTGIEKDFGKNWSLTLGVNRDTKNDNSSGFASIAYNFGSGFASNITSSVKNAVQNEYKKEFTKKYPNESRDNPTGNPTPEDDGSSGSGNGGGI
ncbi:MAG: hypothetical protein U9N59_05550 [Campylobacterota bacterium]|nr:hypothetical protein [Campylobacterota bacterium]